MMFQGGQVPAWAQNEEQVIGYTMEREITPTEISHRDLLPRPRLHPTIYYRFGRLTVEHDGPRDVGWHQVGGQGSTCEFFGNVPITTTVPERPSQQDVGNLLQQYRSYCANYPDWAEPLVAAQGRRRLVEVWQLGGFRMAHTSRHRFYWAGTPQLRRFLHLLAQGASRRR